MSPLDTILLMLATWYAAHVIVYTDGMFGVFAHARKLGKLFACIYCLAPYAAALLLALWHVAPVVVQVLGVAGGALILYRYTGGNHV